MRQVLYITITLCLILFDSFNTFAAEKNSPWPMFLAAITAKTEESCESRSYWGVYSLVCCPYSPLTFSVTISGVTKRSIAQSCLVATTWEGWARESEGTKTAFGQIISSCGSGSETHQWNFQKGESYLIQLEIVNNIIMVNIYIMNTCELEQSYDVLKRKSFSEDTRVFANSAQKIDEIRLDLTPEIFERILDINK